MSGHLVLARGDLAGAAQSAAAARGALARFGYRDQFQLPLARLETDLHVAQNRPADALTTVEQALDRFEVKRSPRYAWPLLAAGARAPRPPRPPPATGPGRPGAPPAGPAARAGREAGRPGPLEEAHRLTFTAEASQAAPRGRPTDAAAWDAAARPGSVSGIRIRRPRPVPRGRVRPARGDRGAAAQRLPGAGQDSRWTAGGRAPLRGTSSLLARRARISSCGLTSGLRPLLAAPSPRPDLARVRGAGPGRRGPEQAARSPA